VSEANGSNILERAAKKSRSYKGYPYGRVSVIEQKSYPWGCRDGVATERRFRSTVVGKTEKRRSRGRSKKGKEYPSRPHDHVGY